MLEEIIEFCKLIGRLKKIERTGWVTWKGLNIQNPESVAEHVFRTAILTMIIADMKKLDTEKMVRMALLHETGEALIGDWDIHAKKRLGKIVKIEKEKEAIKKMLSLLPSDLSEKYSKLLKEFQAQETKEAKLVHEIEVLEMVMQALEYMKEGYKKEALDDFFDFHTHEFTDEDIKKIYDLMDKERKGLE
jgi:putative hydrolase of HD superfamily